MQTLRLGILFVVMGALALSARAVVYNLVAPAEPHAIGSEVRLNLLILNPGTEDTVLDLSEALEGTLSSESNDWNVTLTAPAMGGLMSIKAGGFAVREYWVVLPDQAEGRLVLSIDNPTLAKVAIETLARVEEDASIRAPLSNFVPQRTAEDAIKRTFAGRFSPHESTYIIYGDEVLAAKFQFSFRYRILGEEAGLGETVPALRGIYFGFTQRSLWDINAESSPFYDTSYMPEILFESQAVLDLEKPGGFHWLGYQFGLRHESNGQTGSISRSMNTVYVRPGFSFGRFDGWNMLVAPKLSFYVGDLSNNPDIEDYRGNVELMLAIGRSDGPALALTARLGKGGQGSLQSDLTFPIKFDRVFDFATYMLIQYWEGYGESLLDYNRKSSTLRFGFSLVR